jgi:hypothetical protein
VADKKAIWIPPALDVFTLASVKALENGTASEAQQKQVLKWLIREICLMDAQVEDVSNVNLTYYNLGRRFVGRCILRAMELPIDTFEKLTKPKETKK